jgi:hypothetical protein
MTTDTSPYLTPAATALLDQIGWPEWRNGNVRVRVRRTNCGIGKIASIDGVPGTDLEIDPTVAIHHLREHLREWLAERGVQVVYRYTGITRAWFVHDDVGYEAFLASYDSYDAALISAATWCAEREAGK